VRNALLAGFTAGRLGGEEFAVILPGAGLQKAIDYSEALRRAIEALRVDIGSQPRQITSSIGVVQWHQGFQTSAEFMRAADAELFRAKAAGRNRVCWAAH
jgi:diguanylate cyclase (GGDEF)-like protein